MVSQQDDLIFNDNGLYGSTSEEIEIGKEVNLSNLSDSDNWRGGLKILLEERIAYWTNFGFKNNNTPVIEELGLKLYASQAVVNELENIISMVETAREVIDDAKRGGKKA